MGRACVCAVCGENIPGPQGLLQVYGSCLCPACETRINTVSPGDWDYDYFIKGLKKLWCSS